MGMVVAEAYRLLERVPLLPECAAAFGPLLLNAFDSRER
jgi:hypothetical protein